MSHALEEPGPWVEPAPRLAGPPPARVSVDPSGPSLHVHAVSLTDPVVLAEALRWSSGARGEPLDIEDIAGRDLSQFLIEAVALGARVMGLAAQTSETSAVQAAVTSASETVAQATGFATERTGEIIAAATANIEQTTNAASARVLSEVQRLVGGENPEIAERLRPILHRVGVDLTQQINTSLAQANAEYRTESERRHHELSELIRNVHREVTNAAASESAAEAVRQSGTQKGWTYEDAMDEMVGSICVGLGEEYQVTGNTAGALPRNKKGDGVLVINGGEARLVFEYHDGKDKPWSEYLPEAERNRRASASLGVVRRAADNQGHVFRVLAPNRLVFAFDPDDGDPEMLRTVIQMMRTVATLSGARTGDVDVAAVRHHITETLAGLGGLEEASRSARAIRGHADKIEKQIEKSLASINRELSSAKIALGSIPASEPEETRDEEDEPIVRKPGPDMGLEPGLYDLI